MQRFKKIKLRFELWGQAWEGVVWATGPAHARSEVLRSFIKGDDIAEPLQTRMYRDDDGKLVKDIVIAGSVFKTEHPELLPDDESELTAYAIDEVRKQLKVVRV